MNLDWVTTVVVGSVVLFLLLVWGVAALIRTRRAHPIVDDTSFEASQGFVALDARYPQLIGMTARAGTELKPQGFILMGTDRLDAVSRGEFIAKDTPVKIVGIDAGFLVVAPLDQLPPANA